MSDDTRIRYRCPATGRRSLAPVLASERVETPRGLAVTVTVACRCGSEHSFTVVQVRGGE